MGKKKKKIALIIDVDNWAFSILANNITEYLKDYFDFEIYSSEMFDGDMTKIFLVCSDCDLIHFMWRGLLNLVDTEGFDYNAKMLGFSKDEFLEKFVKSKKITTSVCDHLYLGDELEMTRKIFNYVDNYIVTSKKIKDIYDKIEDIKKPFSVIHDYVDLELYKTTNLERFNNLEKVVIGWVGNSKFKDGKDDDLKGVNMIIKPAINELIEEGYNLEMNFADRNVNLIPQEKMPEYYSKIHIYICASKSEGTPMPILESMASGVPIISTNVGIVDEVLSGEQREYILNTRSKEALKDAIRRILKDKNTLKRLSQENIKNSINWSWQKNAIKYKEFFDANLKY